MKESKTTYSYLVEHMQNPSFQKVWEMAYDFIQKLPGELCEKLHDSLNKGVDPLDSEPLLQMYIYSYGKMHKAKLHYAFDNLYEEVLKYSEVEIIDYGCGQGLATICYHDYIIEHDLEQHVKKIVLIEPSELAISRAELLCSKFYPEAVIVVINKSFNDLTNEDLLISDNIPTIHLLSNILDVESYDLSHLYRIVKKQSVGKNEYVIVSPMQSLQRIKRLKAFASNIDKNVYFEKYLDKRELQEDKDWTCSVLLCSSNKDVAKGLGLNVDELYNEAFELIKNKDRDNIRCQKVFDEIKFGADAGDMKCQNVLGALYMSGLIIPKNYKEAFRCFSKSAEQGFRPAIANLAVCYKKGAGTEVDHFKEVELFEKAVALKYLPCCSYLAECYILGEGVEKNINKGIELLKYAVEQNDKRSCFLLGKYYQNGVGVERDIPMAIQYYTKAGLLDYKKAIIALVNIFEEENYKDLFENEQFDVFVKGVKLGILDISKITITWSNREPTQIMDGDVIYGSNGLRLIKTLRHYE